MQFKVIQEKAKMGTPMDQVIYTGLFLIKRALKWFKPYFTKYLDGTKNLEIKKIFKDFNNYKDKIKQVFRNTDKERVAVRIL